MKKIITICCFFFIYISHAKETSIPNNHTSNTSSDSQRCDQNLSPPFITSRMNTGKWLAETSNPSKHIILAAGHNNNVSGTTGYNNHGLVIFNGTLHTIESALVKIVTPFMVRVGKERGFSVEQFQMRSSSFLQTAKRLIEYTNSKNAITFEIHSDAPSEGNHRASGYDGHTGIIPPHNGSINPAIECVGAYFGKFAKGYRNLYLPRNGIAIFELFPTNQQITMLVSEAVKTNDYSKVEEFVSPYVHLFYDALKQGGI